MHTLSRFHSSYHLVCDKPRSHPLWKLLLQHVPAERLQFRRLRPCHRLGCSRLQSFSRAHPRCEWVCTLSTGPWDLAHPAGLSCCHPGLDLLLFLLAPDRSTENNRAQGRFHFFKFPRRNSTVSARAASVAATERDGTEPPTSECGTPLPAGQEHVSVARFLKLSTKRPCSARLYPTSPVPAFLL